MFHVRNILNSIRKKKKKPHSEKIQNRSSIPLRFLCTEKLNIEKISDEGYMEDFITSSALALLGGSFGLFLYLGFWGACCGFFVHLSFCLFRKAPSEVSTIPSSLQFLPWTGRAKPFWKARPKLMLSEIEINLEHQPWRTQSSPPPFCSLFDLGIVLSGGENSACLQREQLLGTMKW